MKNTHENRMSEFLTEKNLGKTSRADGYYSEEDSEKHYRKEVRSSQNVWEIPVNEHLDILRFIDRVTPLIPSPKEKLVIEKYLLGYTAQEICACLNLRSKNSVRYIIAKHRNMLKEKLEDYKALREMAENPIYEYVPPQPGPLVEKDIAIGRMMLENVFGFETYIYPFDISAESYKITVKHKDLGTHKLTCEKFLAFVEHIKETM
ncbi:MAG: sigma-70 family RNA polymerase sigma factor [Armatimonadetes bacterium]|nr:sigma-70 family RNA polymerase sigma factor [Candidatus Hippobium faecium]